MTVWGRQRRWAPAGQSPGAGAGSAWTERVLTGLTIVIVSIVAGESIAGMTHKVPKPLLAILVVAGATIMFTLSTEQLLLGWLFLAPILQESAQATRLGHLLSLGLYTAPPLIICVKMLATRGRRPRREWFDYFPAFWVLFVLGSIIVTAPSTLAHGTVGTLRGLYQTVAMGAVAYYLAAFWRGRPLSTTRICGVLLVGALLQSLMTIVEWRTGWNLWHDTSWQQPGDVRAIGTLSNPDLTGGFIGGAMVIALAVLAWNGPARLRRLSIAMLPIGLIGLYAVKTRAPVIAMLAAALVILLLSKRARLVGIGGIALVGLLIALFWPTIKSSSVYQNRLNQTQNVEIRLILQKISIKLAEERPILGWGYNSFDRVKFKVPIQTTSVPLAGALASTSHDTYLTMLVQYGLVGFVIFALPGVLVFWRSLRRARAPGPDRWFFIAAPAAVFVIAFTAATLDYRFFSFVPAIPWLLLGLVRRTAADESLTA